MVCQAAAKHLTPVSLELGGKAPAIVCASADLTIAAKRIAWGAFLNSGQTCVRPDYVLVHASVADRFIAEVKKAVQDFYGEDAQKSDFFGRIINDFQHERLTKMLQDAKDRKKAKIIIGGDGLASDRFISPTVLDFGDDEASFRSSMVMKEEIFGPIMPVFRFNDLQWAVDFVREGEKPLSVYPFSKRPQDQELILRETSSGGCDVNDVIMRLSNPDLPFGGVGNSGMGSYHGVSSFMCFSHRKSVSFKTNWLDLPVRYPPYANWKRSALAVIQTVRPASQVKTMKTIVILAALVL